MSTPKCDIKIYFCETGNIMKLRKNVSVTEIIVLRTSFVEKALPNLLHYVKEYVGSYKSFPSDY